MDVSRFAELFPLGSHLCREPAPFLDELKHDMGVLKARGFNLVKIQEHWAYDEPVEGQCDFSRAAALIEHAASLDLGVYLGLTCEHAPGWLWSKHPDCRQVGHDGVPIAYEAQYTLPADGKPGPCFDSPGATEDMVRFIGELVRTLGRYENIVVWNTWQEVGYWSEQIVGRRTCHCANTVAFFREYLKRKYGEPGVLNAAWGTRYADWDSVKPVSTAPGKDGLPADKDWNQFMNNVQVARVLRRRSEVIARLDPFKRPVFAHRNGPTIGSGADWGIARCQDFFGSSAYPAWGSGHPWDDWKRGRLTRDEALRTEAWDGIALKFDHIRSASPPKARVWAAEFQGGPVVTGLHKGRVPSATDIRRWMLTAVGSGVTGIAFWVTRAEIAAPEMNGFSLLDSTGDRTDRCDEAARIGAALNRHPELFGRNTWSGAPVAILVDESNWSFCSSMADAAEHLSYSTRGWHRLLWDAGIPVDFVRAADLDPVRHQAVIHPFPLSLSEETAGKLKAYVEGGGHLVGEACPGRIDGRGFANRGELSPVAAGLYGVRHAGLTIVREPGQEPRWTPVERTWGEFAPAAVLSGTGPLKGAKVRAGFYIETFEPTASRPCLMYGRAVAGTVRKAGQGAAWLIGTLAGHAGCAYRDAATRTSLLRILAACGIRPAHAGRLLLRKRMAGNKEGWVFTNPTGAAVTESIDVRGCAKVADLLDEPLKRKGRRIALRVDALDVRVLVVERT